MSDMGSLLKSKTIKNASWLIAGKVAQMLISLVVSLLTARYLGPSNYGLINYAAAYTSFFTSICTLGINSVLVKEFIDNPSREGEIIGTSLCLKALSSFLSAITIILIVSIVDKGEPITLAVVMLTSVGLIFNIFETFNYWFQSRLESKITAISTFIAYGITSAYKVILIIKGCDVRYFAFANAIDYLCIGFLLIVFYKRHNGSRLKFSSQYGRLLLSKSYHFILPGLMVAVYAQTDKLMLKQMISVEEIGYYATALSVCTMWCFVLTAIIESVYPSIMEANKTDEFMFNRRNKQLYAIVFYLSIFVSLLITVFAELIINMLYGKDYIQAINPLRVITWYTAFSYLGVARNAWIVSKNRQKYLKYVYFSAAVSNVILNLLLIPSLGASGAALASFVAQFLTTMVVPCFIPDLRENTRLMIEAILLKDVFDFSRLRRKE